MNRVTETSTNIEALVSAVADQFTEEVKQGRSPSISEYAAAHPEIASIIRQVFPALALLDSPQSAPQSPEIRDDVVPGQLGDFRIVQEIGRGGMGVVYEAEQISIGRRVALKVLPFASMLDKKQLNRFKNEARAAGSLDHPHIVSVHSVGDERGVHYYTMQLVEGHSLAEVIGTRRRARQREASRDVTDTATCGPWHGKTHGELETQPVATLSTLPTSDTQNYIRTVTQLIVQAAEAIDHAHQNGIIHRDVKPGNLLVDTDGKLYVTDFGLARLEADAGITMTGDLLGTLRYMSPEQALAKRVVVDHRSDIYSLGATLYELLTLQPAFAATDRQDLLRQIAFEEPRLPRGFDPSIPRELETIALKAMEKDPADRYEAAQELANDLQCYLDDRPISARPPTLISRARKWSRRHVEVVWTVMATSILAACLLAVSAALIANSAKAARQQRQRAVDEKNKAVQERNVARQNLYYAEIVSGQTDWQFGNLAALDSKLIHHLPTATADRRGWEWRYLYSLCHPERISLGPVWTVTDGAWSPDGQLLAGTTDEGFAAVWNANTHELTRVLTPSLREKCCITWSPDSNMLAWGEVCTPTDPANIHVWDRKSDQLSVLRGHTQSVWELDWSPDSAKLASAAIDKTIRIWDAKGKLLRTLPRFHSNPSDLKWSPDSELLASCDYYHSRAIILNPTTGEAIVELKRPVRGLDWRPDGQQLAVAGDLGLELLDTDTWKSVKEVTDQPCWSVAWHPSGSMLAADSTGVTVWDCDDAFQARLLSTDRRDVTSLEWSPDGQQLLSRNKDDELNVWDLNSYPKYRVFSVGGHLQTMKKGYESAAWRLHDNQTVATVSATDAALSLHDAVTGEQTERRTPGVEGRIDWCPDHERFAVRDDSAGSSRILIIDSAGDMQAILRQEGLVPDRSYRQIWSPDGRRLAVVGKYNRELRIEIWDVEAERRIATWPAGKILVNTWALRSVAWAPDSRQLAICDYGDKSSGPFRWQVFVHVIDVSTGKRVLRHVARLLDEPAAVAWSLDGMLAVGGGEGRVEVFDSTTERVRFTVRIHNAAVASIAWHPDGTRIASASGDGVVQVSSASGGNSLLTFRLQRGNYRVNWSPDGTRLLAAAEDGTIHIWDASQGYKLNERRGELAAAYLRRSQLESGATRETTVDRILDIVPRTLEYRILRGDLFAHRGDYDMASQEFFAVMRPNPATAVDAAYYYTRALLGARDLNAYSVICKELWEIARDGVDSAYNLWLLESCVYVPNVIDDPQEILSAAAQLPASEYTKFVVGAALYRDGQLAKSIENLAKLEMELLSLDPTNLATQLARNLYFQSMVRHHLGHSFQAKRLWQAAIENHLKATEQDAPWWIRFSETLRCEAEEVVKE